MSGQKMKTLILLFAFACVATASAALDEKPVRMSGALTLRIFPGRPNYESVEKSDEAEPAWILTVTTEKKKEEFQLVVLDRSGATFAALRRSSGKKIGVEGLMWEAQTGHHHTPFLIRVRAIEEERNQAPEPPASSGRSSS